MKKTIIILSILLINTWLKSQNVDYHSIQSAILNLGDVQDGNENFDNFSGLKPILKDVEIVMMGEQSHGEATVYDTKIKLFPDSEKEHLVAELYFESELYCFKSASKSFSSFDFAAISA